MKDTSNDPLRVLRYWRDLEVFNIPDAPSKRDESAQTKIFTFENHSSSQSNVLPWRRKDCQPTEQHGFFHVVYLGVTEKEKLTRLLLQTLFTEHEISERERQRVNGNGWLAAFVVNERGIPKNDSYLPASFVQGVAALREKGSLEKLNLRLEQATQEFTQRRNKVSPPQQDTEGGEGAAVADENDAWMSWDDLAEEFRVVHDLFGSRIKDADVEWRVVVRSSRVQRRYLDENLEAATEFLNSFYLDDLDLLIDQVKLGRGLGRAFEAYLGPALPVRQRVDILTDNAAMTSLVGARNIPSARWPSSPKHPLVLAQQAAVSNVVYSLGQSEGLIGVNGPPGTGKTTLLCDVIAEVVTERARRIAKLDRPSDLFDEKLIVAGKGFYPLKSEVIGGTSIVVTSTNNNAVKNITQELPARMKVAPEFVSANYFSAVMREVFRAQKILGDDGEPVDTWGTIAAALGNVANRNSFSKGFFRDEFIPHAQTDSSNRKEGEKSAGTGSGYQASDESPVAPKPDSMRQVLQRATHEYFHYLGEWKRAKEDFLGLQAQFAENRKVLERAENAALLMKSVRSWLDRVMLQQDVLDEDIRAREVDLGQRRVMVTNQRAAVEGSRAVLEQLRGATSPNLWDRFMALFGRETRRMAALRIALQGPARNLEEASNVLANMVSELVLGETHLKEQRGKQKSLSIRRSTLENELQTHQRAVDGAYALGAKHFPDEKFWDLPPETRHRASIAVGPKLDDLRARIFLQAMELHRLTVLVNAGKFIANLRAVNGMLTGSTREKLAPEHRPLVWDAFFFVVPVVSTTLASFDRLFVGMGQSSLGWLLIDEAGQATPQSAAGAIWRSRRAVIVGDPLQIEPVFTVPKSLAEQLRRSHGVCEQWSPIDESVQTLADRITQYGSWIAKDQGDEHDDETELLWTGMPLRTHRRCDEPMFTIANRIAYAGQMVQGRVDKSGLPLPWDFSCSLGESAWFDVRSKRVNHPVSEDEIACLLGLLAKLPREMNADAKVYVISPFRKVAKECGMRVRRAGFGGIECGTVHTFQGKEAHIVFLVLGTAAGQGGAGARSWAASKPNMLNVAVTRAKCRLYVIGDASQWGGLDYFRELLSALPRIWTQEYETTMVAHERL